MNIGHPEIADWEVELGQRWFRTVVADLERADRDLEGGWPGTLSDARRLVGQRWRALSLVPEATAIERSTQAIYRVAKDRWLELASRRPKQTEDT